MSAFIPPVTPVNTSTAAQPTGGSTFVATSGETIAVTDPSANSSNPVVIVAPTSGSFTVAPSTQGANVEIEGTGDATANIGTSQDGAGNVLNASGSTIQVNDSYTGSVIANFAGSPVDGTKVDISTDTGTGTIADNLSGGGQAFQSNLDLYVNTGAGADQIEGSRGNDFIRAGAGNDVVNSGAGDDIVRLGSGDDQVTLGSGEDIVYFTVDQLQGNQSKTITDFDANGNDKIQIDADLQGLVDISGQGTNKITISLSGAQTGTTTVESGGQTIDDDDIEFV